MTFKPLTKDMHWNHWDKEICKLSDVFSAVQGLRNAVRLPPFSEDLLTKEQADLLYEFNRLIEYWFPVFKEELLSQPSLIKSPKADEVVGNGQSGDAGELKTEIEGLMTFPDSVPKHAPRKGLGMKCGMGLHKSCTSKKRCGCSCHKTIKEGGEE